MALVKQQEKLFELWHRVRDGTLSRDDFGELVVEIRSSIKAILTEADSYSIGTREKTPLAKTVRTCRQLLKVESAMWLFVATVGVEPTNNAAERAIRPAVIWRRTSFGSQTQAGSNESGSDINCSNNPQVPKTECFGVYDSSCCGCSRWYYRSFFASIH